MSTAVTAGRKADTLTVAANKATAAGDAATASRLTREAADAADTSRRAAEIANQYAGSRLFARVRPTAIYTGDQDLSAGFRAVDEGSKYLEGGGGPVVRDQPSDSEYRQSREELAAITTRGEIDVTSAVRIGVPNDVLIKAGVPTTAIRAAIAGLRENVQTDTPVLVRPAKPNEIELPTRPTQDKLNTERDRIAEDLKNTPVPMPMDVLTPRMRPPADGNGGGRVKPPPDDNGGGRVRDPGRRRDDTITRPPGKPADPVKYKLPGGKSLERGEFPVEVTWPQGVVQITRNLLSGETTYKARTPDETTPSEGFTVSGIGFTRPRPQVLDMGQTDALVSKDYISFRSSPPAAAGRQFRRSGGRL